MTDAITRRANGQYEMASTRREWHNYQNLITSDAPREEWIAKAGFDFSLKRSKVRYATERGMDMGILEMPSQHVLWRSDTKAPLSVVSEGFQVVQPAQVFDWIADLCQSAGFKLETAGTLFGGRKFWALASIGDECEIVPKDKCGGYLGLATSCDGSMATTGQFTMVRWVCNNTLQMSLAQGGLAKITHRSTFDPNVMKAKLGIAHETFKTFSQNMRALADKSVSAARAERLAFDLFKPAGFDTQSPSEKLATLEKVSDSRGMRAVLALFEGDAKGARMDGVQGTAWGWLNAVTEYADHHVRATSDENRLESSMFGAGAALKGKALALASAI